MIYIKITIGLMSEYKKTALVLGAGGFIGSHMVKRLRVPRDTGCVVWTLSILSFLSTQKQMNLSGRSA